MTNESKWNRRCICDPCEVMKLLTGNPPPLSDRELNDVKLSLFLERNSNGSSYLILHGKVMFQKFNNRITDHDIRAIARFIKTSSTRVTLLDLSYNEITDEGFKLLIKLLYVHSSCSLTHLNVMNNNMTEESMQSLHKFAKHIKLVCLRLTGNMLGTKGAEYLAGFLLENTTLKCLDIGETQMNFSSLAYICSSLHAQEGGNKTLKVLNLSRLLPLFNRYDLEPKWVVHQIQFLLEYNNVITELRLQKNELTGHDMESIAIALKNNKSLRCLDLGYNRIADLGLELLARVLPVTAELVYLNVAGNSIGNVGAKALSYAIPYSKVRCLDLSQNFLSDPGIIDILYIIRKPLRIQYLNLWGNSLGASACEMLRYLIDSDKLSENALDVRIYGVDGSLYPAYQWNNSDSGLYNYNVAQYAFAPPITHIKRNNLARSRIDYMDGKHRHKPESSHTCDT